MRDVPPTDPTEPAKDFAHRWVDRLENAVEGRMHELEIPAEQIGTSDYLHGVAWRTFFPDEHDGGNVTEDGRINVDSGVLNPELMTGIYGEEAGKIWAKSRLRDRIDAIVIHEEAEHREGSHQAALETAPETTRPITDGTRRILRAMRGR